MPNVTGIRAAFDSNRTVNLSRNTMNKAMKAALEDGVFQPSEKKAFSEEFYGFMTGDGNPTDAAFKKYSQLESKYGLEHLFGDTPAPAKSFTQGAGSPVTLGALSATKLDPSDDVKAMTKKLFDASGGNGVDAGQYKLDPAALKDVLKHASTAKPFVFDAANAIADDGGTTTKFADTPRAGRSVKELRRGDVFAAMWDALEVGTTIDKQGNETPESKAATKQAKADLRELVKSLLADPTTKIYLTEWNNQDDTNIRSIVAVNENEGTMNVVKMFPAI